MFLRKIKDICISNNKISVTRDANISIVDLEEQIMDCWGVVDDIKTVYSASDGREVSEDEMMNAVQLLLSEGRTALSLMRTGIAVFALPLSVLSVLIATSKYYEALAVLDLLIPLIALCAMLVLLGGYLVIHSMLKIRRLDRLIHRIKLEHSAIAEFLDPIE